MKNSAAHIQNLAETFAALLEREQRACAEAISSLADAIRSLQGETNDRRLQRLAAQLRQLRERLDLLAALGRDDFLAKIAREARELREAGADARAASVLASLVELRAPALAPFCETLLESLCEATGAERGFVLAYLPESTEADILAARNFQTTNLSLEEYDFSRTLLGEVFKRGAALLIEDATNEPSFAAEASVRRLELKSVLAVPLAQDGRALGALYLENNSAPCAFGEAELRLLEQVARFAVFYLRHARLLPAAFSREGRVFFDASKAAEGLVGTDPKIVALHEMISRVADSPATVLVEGESGTGKELVARALHYQSARRARPFVAINCAAIPENLLESELFGHERGAFTGAAERRTGLVEQAEGGTLFLDEVSELAYALQAKLLRFLQSSEFHRVGARETTRVDVRVVAATGKDLRALASAGKFQEALYYRLNVIPLLLPPLRERRGDIPLLVEHFVEKFSAAYGRSVRVEPEVLFVLEEYPFHGNVRELENLMHRLVALAPDDQIRVGDLPAEVLNLSPRRVSLAKDPLYKILGTAPADLAELRRRREEVRRVLAEQERELAARAIAEAGGNLTEAAARMKVHRVTLHKMLRKSERPRD
ncbi:MAG: sigma 54-interacting transcriptional regulator [Acidobacteria bacterium]|nr:sigma 54-interacting transcriptional regulator [Acidobacteriota bacterium]MCA1642934.1 sigma 54-interacting transcriptional regulator [Acidobacteriota bacterium]